MRAAERRRASAAFSHVLSTEVSSDLQADLGHKSDDGEDLNCGGDAPATSGTMVAPVNNVFQGLAEEQR